MKNILFLFGVILLLQGCATRGTGGSYVGADLAHNVNQSISHDIADFVERDNAPGHTQVRLFTPKEKAENAFSQTLENTFRQRGFIISESSTFSIAYILDKLMTGENYVQLTIANKEKVGRMYSASGTPVSNWTMTEYTPISIEQKAKNTFVKVKTETRMFKNRIHTDGGYAK